MNGLQRGKEGMYVADWDGCSGVGEHVRGRTKEENPGVSSERPGL